MPGATPLRGEAPVEAQLEKLEGVRPACDGLYCDVGLLVEVEEVRIRGSNCGDDCKDDPLSGLPGRQEITLAACVARLNWPQRSICQLALKNGLKSEYGFRAPDSAGQGGLIYSETLVRVGTAAPVTCGNCAARTTMALPMYCSTLAAAILTSLFSFNAESIRPSSTGSPNCLHHCVSAICCASLSAKRQFSGVSTAGLW